MPGMSYNIMYAAERKKKYIAPGLIIYTICRADVIS